MKAPSGSSDYVRNSSNSETIVTKAGSSIRSSPSQGRSKRHSRTKSGGTMYKPRTLLTRARSCGDAPNCVRGHLHTRTEWIEVDIRKQVLKKQKGPNTDKPLPPPPIEPSYTIQNVPPGLQYGVKPRVEHLGDNRHQSLDAGGTLVSDTKQDTGELGRQRSVDAGTQTDPNKRIINPKSLYIPDDQAIPHKPRVQVPILKQPQPRSGRRALQHLALQYKDLPDVPILNSHLEYCSNQGPPREKCTAYMSNPLESSKERHSHGIPKSAKASPPSPELQTDSRNGDCNLNIESCNVPDPDVNPIKPSTKDSSQNDIRLNLDCNESPHSESYNSMHPSPLALHPQNAIASLHHSPTDPFPKTTSFLNSTTTDSRAVPNTPERQISPLDIASPNLSTPGAHPPPLNLREQPLRKPHSTTEFQRARRQNSCNTPSRNHQPVAAYSPVAPHPFTPLENSVDRELLRLEGRHDQGSRGYGGYTGQTARNTTSEPSLISGTDSRQDEKLGGPVDGKVKQAHGNISPIPAMTSSQAQAYKRHGKYGHRKMGSPPTVVKPSMFSHTQAGRDQRRSRQRDSKRMSIAPLEPKAIRPTCCPTHPPNQHPQSSSPLPQLPDGYSQSRTGVSAGTIPSAPQLQMSPSTNELTEELTRSTYTSLPSDPDYVKERDYITLLRQYQCSSNGYRGWELRWRWEEILLSRGDERAKAQVEKDWAGREKGSGGLRYPQWVLDRMKKSHAERLDETPNKEEGKARESEKEHKQMNTYAADTERRQELDAQRIRQVMWEHVQQDWRKSGKRKHRNPALHYRPVAANNTGIASAPTTPIRFGPTKNEGEHPATIMKPKGTEHGAKPEHHRHRSKGRARHEGSRRGGDKVDEARRIQMGKGTTVQLELQGIINEDEEWEKRIQEEERRMEVEKTQAGAEQLTTRLRSSSVYVEDAPFKVMKGPPAPRVPTSVEPDGTCVEG